MGVDELAAKGPHRISRLYTGLYFLVLGQVRHPLVVVFFRNGIQDRLRRRDCLQYGQARLAEILGDDLAYRRWQLDLVRFHAGTVFMACDSGSAVCPFYAP